jgi:uncharacterized protein involved in response to NO
MAYGIVLMALWAAAQWEYPALPHGALTPRLWHGHEMMFGFAGAIICATVLTALPGWAHTPEIAGAPLAGLVALWLAGRVAFLCAAWLPPSLVVVADAGLYVALLALLAPQLWRVANRHYLLLLPVFAGMLAGDALFLAGDEATGLTRVDGARVPAARPRRPRCGRRRTLYGCHAFTVSALGSMRLGLLTRVALRHAGRPLALPAAIVAAYLLIQAAAVLRVAGAMTDAGALPVMLAGGAWIAAFAIYLACFGSMLVAPSLPRVASNPLTAEAGQRPRDDAR